MLPLSLDEPLLPTEFRQAAGPAAMLMPAATPTDDSLMGAEALPTPEEPHVKDLVGTGDSVASVGTVADPYKEEKNLLAGNLLVEQRLSPGDLAETDASGQTQDSVESDNLRAAEADLLMIAAEPSAEPVAERVAEPMAVDSAAEFF